MVEVTEILDPAKVSQFIPGNSSLNSIVSSGLYFIGSLFHCGYKCVKDFIQWQIGIQTGHTAALLSEQKRKDDSFTVERGEFISAIKDLRDEVERIGRRIP